MQVRISKELLSLILHYERLNYESNDFFCLNVENGVVISAEMTYDNGLETKIKTIKED